MVTLARRVDRAAPEQQEKDETIEQQEGHTQTHSDEEGSRVTHVLVGVGKSQLGGTAVVGEVRAD